MKETKVVYLVAKQEEWQNAPSFSILGYDPRSFDCMKGYLVLEEIPIEVDIPEKLDMRPHMVEKLRAEREAIREKASDEIAVIDQKIESLLAIEA